jgi:hypothetical protein
MRAAAFIAIELAFLAIAHVLGGPAWTVLGVLACVAQSTASLRPADLATLAPALAWAVAAKATGNRELYFPFAMHVAAVTAAVPAAAQGLRCLAVGGTVVFAFLAIRWLQAATPRVLAVEAAAAVLVLIAAVAARQRFPATAGRWWIPAAAAVLAYGCLAL